MFNVTLKYCYTTRKLSRAWNKGSSYMLFLLELLFILYTVYGYLQQCHGNKMH